MKADQIKNIDDVKVWAVGHETLCDANTKYQKQGMSVVFDKIDKNDKRISKLETKMATYIGGGLVIATILGGKLILTEEQYVLCVVVIILTTVASPFMLSAGFAWLDSVEKAERVKYKDVTVKIGTFFRSWGIMEFGGGLI